jgi:acid phosphatase
VTHPSQPNYVASVAGDHFGLDSGDFVTIPSNIFTVVDLLDTKGISWGEYQESLPYPGFEVSMPANHCSRGVSSKLRDVQGLNYSNQQTYHNDYVRKHNPLISFDSIAQNETRRSQIKGFSHFEDDLRDEKIPQWSFVTPNMTNNAHDTNVGVAGAWSRRFLEPLLKNQYLMNNTLIMLTFDECEVYPHQNRIYTALLGGAIPDHLKGTVDDTFYTHYSTLSTVSVNWELPSLGRWDCDANVLKLVAEKTRYRNADVQLENLYFNWSYPGPLSNNAYIPEWPAPDTRARCASGLGVLDRVKSVWGDRNGYYDYRNVYPYDVASGSNVGTGLVRGVNENTTVGPERAANPSNSGGTGVMISGLAMICGILGVAAIL